MKKIQKGDMIRFQLDGNTFYGTILSIVDEVCAVSHHSYSTGIDTVSQVKISELVKIGSK